jgi:hypothetical protein
LDPVTTINSRAPNQKFIWVKKLFLFIRQSSIKTKFKRIYIHLLFYSIKKFLFLLVIFPKALQAIFTKKKADKPKNRLFQYISNKIRAWNRKGKEEGPVFNNNLLLKGLKLADQDGRCMDPDGETLWCMTKYKPVAKKVRPVNQAMPQSINPPLQRPPATEEFSKAFAGRACDGLGDIMGGNNKRESTERVIEIIPKQPVQQQDSNQLGQRNSRIQKLQSTGFNKSSRENAKFSISNCSDLTWI